MKYNNIAQTLRGNGCYAGPIGEGERAVVAAVHLMSFRAVFESLQKLPATSDRPMVQPNNYSGPLERGISDCDKHTSSFKTKRQGLVGPQGFEPRTKGL